MPTDDEFEDGFARVLRGAAELAPEPVQHTLAAVAEQRGRRWRRRRRTVIAGGLAVLVLAGAGGFAAVDRGTFGAVGPADPGPTGPRMSSDELLTLVTGMLPNGTVKVLHGNAPKFLSGHQAGLVLMYDDGAGESIVEVAAERTNLRPEAGAVCTDPFKMPQDSCKRTIRPDGAAIAIDKLRSTTTQDGREWRATLALPDGSRVMATEYNGQPATANRPSPPLNDSQLTTLVCSVEWLRVFAALAPVEGAPNPGDAPAPIPSKSAPPNPELVPEVIPLLPAGAKVESQDPGRGVLTVTVDGRTSMLMVGQEPPSQRGRDELKSMDGDLPTPLEAREKRPDGTLVVTDRFGNGKTATDPILHWTAEVHSPDGGQVRISEWNGENAYTFRPGDPALDVDHLKAIVTAPVWRS